MLHLHLRFLYLGSQTIKKCSVRGENLHPVKFQTLTNDAILKAVVSTLCVLFIFVEMLKVPVLTRKTLERFDGDLDLFFLVFASHETSVDASEVTCSRKEKHFIAED